ncbi:MAG: glycoside hydrolase family 78 protein [Firmicutes bacterium]|nr:glycoside hydrolase family 78 protein [Bacillota bacterium]
MSKSKRAAAAFAALALVAAVLPAVPISAAENTAPSAPTGLLTNDLENPLNVEDVTFGWIVNDSDYNEVQTAYEIVVTDAMTDTDVWDSGKVASSAQSYVTYGGDTLAEGHPYTWRVRTWDKDDEASEYSETAEFSTGIADENWNAAWISDGTGGVDKSQGKYNHYWYVRGTGSIDASKTVAYARGYFAAEQDYDLYINGVEIGRGQSFDYASETHYQGWDVTDAVKSCADSITIGALVRTYGSGQGRAATDAGFIGRVNVYYTDGTCDTIATGSDWLVSDSVPLGGTTTRNSEGDFVEEYNAQAAQTDFSTADFDASDWSAATVLGTNTTDAITAMYPELSKITSELVYPESVTTLSDGTTIADFGRVIPARPEITFKNGVAGTTYTIQAGYELTSSGTIATSDLKTQSTKMTWKYTQTDGEQVYDAWDHLGFRYLSIPACGETFTEETIAAKIVHTVVPEGRGSTLETSNEMLNSVYDMLKRSALYSIQNSFVDTPTREKGQFLQDSINISEATVATQYERAATKKAIEQFIASAERYWSDEDNLGRMNSVYPNGDGARDIPDFTINFPYWVYNYYMQTGDTALLEKVYPYVKNVSDYIIKYISADTGLVTKLYGGEKSSSSYMYGIVDWPSSGRFGYDWSGTKEGARTTVNMLSKRAFDVTAELAEALGYTEDAESYSAKSETLKAAINEKLINSDGVYCDGLNSSGNQVSAASQHSTSYALAFDVAPEKYADEMAEYVADMGMRQGPMTADILVKGLAVAGENTALLKLFTEPNDYGWANEIANDYTFTFESWDADSTENSQSHGWGATAAADMLEAFAGVTVTGAGASSVRIAPIYTDLTSLDASVETERGAVKVAYERNDTEYTINITVPTNMTAEIALPVIGEGKFVEQSGNADEGTIGGEYQTISVGSGVYTFSYEGEITVLPEEVEYDENLDTVTYDFTGLDSDTYNADYSGEYAYNDLITLNFGTGSSSISESGNGMDLYSDGSYIAFTPDKDGSVVLEIIMRNNSTLYMGTSLTDGTAIAATVSTKTETTSYEVDVEAGVTYYIYNSGSNPTSVKSLSYSYPHEEFEGIKGSYSGGEYTWQIGTGSAGEKYDYSDDYAAIRVSLGSGDNMTEEGGIYFSSPSVMEPGTSVADTERYILITPAYDSTLYVTISYPTAASNAHGRVYGYNYGADAGDYDTLDLTKLYKAAEDTVCDSTTSSAVTGEYEMKGGNTYALYTYNRYSYITALSMSIDTVSSPTPTATAEPTATPTTTPTITPTTAPTATPTVTPIPSGFTYSDSTVTAYERGVIIIADYDENGTLTGIDIQEVKSGDTIEVEPKEGRMIYMWDSMDKMKPIAVAVNAATSPTSAPASTPTAAPTQPEENEDSAITLDRYVYPLVVGNSSKTDFSDWESRGSYFTLNATVDSDEYDESDLTWYIEDGSQRAVYTITVVSAENFVNQNYDLTAVVSSKTTMDSYDNYTTEFLGNTEDNPIIICGGGSSDYLDTSVGLHINGKSSSGARYIAYTAPCDGTLTVSARRAYSNAALYVANNSSFTGGSSIANLSNNSSWADGMIEVTGGTTYYLYCVNSGMEIKSLSFTGEKK